MNKPLVSICVPVYNGQRWLRECLDSCMEQTYANYEVVVCDDGSNDNSRLIINEYIARHKHLKFYQNEKNLGLVGNWNRCLELASGEWIKFVFQDDQITNDCLEKFVAAINDKTVLLVSERNFVLPPAATADQVNYYSKVVRTLKNTCSQRSPFYSAQTISRIAIRHPLMNFIGEPSLTFFKKELIQTVGLFDERLKQICDLEFFLRIGSRFGLTYIPEKLCAFRIHGASTTNTNVHSRFFELRYIEPLLMSFMMLYENTFSQLRKHIGLLGRLKLNIYFRLKAYEAHQASQKNVVNHNIFSEIQYEAILRHKTGGLLIRLLSTLRKGV